MQRLKVLHELGMAYRDFKPANILVGEEEDSSMVYLIDFGLSTRCLNDSY